MAKVGVSQTFKKITFASLFLKGLLEELLAAVEFLPSLVTPFRLGVKMENFSAAQRRCCILTFPRTGQKVETNESLLQFFLWQQRG